MKKRIVSLVLVILVVCGALLISKTVDDNSTKIVVDASVLKDTQYKEGDVIQIPVRITNNPGFAAYVLTAKWNEEDFEPCETLYTAGELCQVGYFLSGENAQFVNASNIYGDGVLFNISLRLKKSVKDAKIEVYFEDDQTICNENAEDVKVKLSKGVISAKVYRSSESMRIAQNDQITLSDSNNNLSLNPVNGIVDHTKFYFGLTSGATVSFVVNDDYGIVITLPAGATVNTQSVSIETKFKNVASLGVSSVRTYLFEVNTGLGDHEVALSTWLSNSYAFDEGVLNLTLEDNEISYTFGAYESGQIVGTTNTASARTAWQAIAQYFTVQSESSEKKQIVIANGSYIKVGTQLVQFKNKNNLVIDDFSSLANIETAIKGAIEIAQCEDNGNKIEILIKSGSMIWDGLSSASVNADWKTVFTVEDENYLDAIDFSELKNAQDKITLVQKFVGLFDEVVGILDTSSSVDMAVSFIEYSILPGDLDEDGDVDSDDAIYLLWSTFRPNDYPLNQSGDFNMDSDVDSDDAIYLLWYTFKPNDYPLYYEKN